jgi:hypothetical protein
MHLRPLVVTSPLTANPPCGPDFFGVTGQQKLDGVHNLAVSWFFPSLRALATFTATRRVGSWILKISNGVNTP